MTKAKNNNQKKRQDIRFEREAEALKKNLLKRKQQQEALEQQKETRQKEMTHG